MVKLDIVGKKFGRLTVLEILSERNPNRNGGVMWKFKCDCGNITVHEGNRVYRGDIISCGCSRRSKDRRLSALKMYYTTYSYGARKRSLKFDLTFDEFVSLTEGSCFYCGEVPRERVRKEFSCTINGVDRLTNSEGYSTYNCVACCETCNYRKGNMNVLEFLDWIKKVNNHIASAPVM